MVPTVFRLAFLFIALGVALPLAPDAQAQPPRVEGYRCKPLAATRPANQIWWTNFQGQREDFWDRLETYRAVVCFKSAADCKAWLYWAQTDWPQNQWLPCRRGVP